MLFYRANGFFVVDVADLYQVNVVLRTKIVEINPAGFFLRPVVCEADGQVQFSSRRIDLFHAGKPEADTGNETKSHKVYRVYRVYRVESQARLVHRVNRLS